MPPPNHTKTRLQRDTRRLMLRRSMWRKRALAAALQLVRCPVGAPEREAHEAETHKAINKVRELFRSQRAEIVINAIQRRAIAEFRRIDAGRTGETNA